MTRDTAPRSPHAPAPGDEKLLGPADAILDSSIAAARRGPAGDETAAAKARAWARLRDEAGSGASIPGGSSSDSACTEIRTEFAAFLAGRLSSDRAELIADHGRECLPCRRELARLRDGRPADALAAESARPSRRLGRLVQLGIAASVLAATVTTLVLVGGADAGRPAHVAQLDGQIILEDGGSVALAEGALVAAGRSIRTAKGSRAILELPDGSRVEMNERAEIRFAEDGDSLTVELARGEIIMAAAKRHRRDLFVRTGACTVAVKGTVFTVGHGLKGSRVAVLEGEVHVEKDGDRHVLKPGDQVATSTDLADEPLENQVAWSLSRDDWSALVREVDEAAAQVESEQIPPAIRYESRILDAMPANVVFYAALPNGGSLARFVELVGERVSDNPQLAPWWQAQVTGTQAGPSVAGLLRSLGELSSAVGDEIVMAFVLPDGDPGADPAPILVAPVADEGALRDAVAALAGRSESELLLTDLAGLEQAAGARSEFALVLHSGHVLAGPSAEALAQVAARLDEGSVASTPFLDSVRAEYRKGTEFVLAADLAALVDRSVAAHAAKSVPDQDDAFARVLGAVGLDGIDRFVVSAGETNPGLATLSFRDDRHGMAAWLDEPAPMGSLAFVTPQASAVVAAVFRDPEILLLDLDERLGPKGFRESLESFRQDTGVDLFEDVAAPLGGEVAFALDGPLLPEPSWKLVMEVYDQQRLEQSIMRLVERADAWGREHAPADGRAARTFSVADQKTSEGPTRVLNLDQMRVHYAYRDGYLVACPSQQLLVGALQARRTGSIADSTKLRALLPKGTDHVSLLAYEDFGSLLGQLGQLGEAARNAAFLPAQAQAFAASGPMLLHARASDRAITLGLSAREGGPSAQVAGLLRRAVVQGLTERAAARAGGIGYDDAAADPRTRRTTPAREP